MVFHFFNSLITIGKAMAMKIMIPGTEMYGLYHGKLSAFAFLTSSRNQLPISMAATRTEMNERN